MEWSIIPLGVAAFVAAMFDFRMGWEAFIHRDGAANVVIHILSGICLIIMSGGIFISLV
jgi:hypothetical protein